MVIEVKILVNVYKIKRAATEYTTKSFENVSVEQLQVNYISMQTTDTYYSNIYFTDITTNLSKKVSSHMSMT